MRQDRDPSADLAWRTLEEFVEFVRRHHVGHDVEKGCTTGICKEIERLEKEGLVSKR
jgi:hypothetical protein